MAQNSWPSPSHNSRAVTDIEYEKLAGRFSEDGIYGTPADTAVVSAGPGLSVNIRADVFGSLRGHAWTSGTSTVNLTVGANSSGSTRIDSVVLRLDRSTWTVRAVIKAGTPGAGAPALTQQTGDTGVYEILLAPVTVLNSAAAVSVKRNELYVGSRVRPLTSTTPNPTALPGELQWETDTGNLSVFDGTTRRTVYGYSGDVAVGASVSGWTTVVDPVLERRNGVVVLRLGQFARSGGNLAGETDSRLPVLIPSTYRHPDRNVYAGAYITGARPGRLTIYPASHARAGQVWLSQKPALTNSDDVLPFDVSWVKN